MHPNEVEAKQIVEIINSAKAYNLEYELLTFALKAMKENPDISILLAVQMGADEWDL
jgi:hypothetical protein